VSESEGGLSVGSWSADAEGVLGEMGGFEMGGAAGVGMGDEMVVLVDEVTITRKYTKR
jgi:hypothetical protein